MFFFPSGQSAPVVTRATMSSATVLLPLSGFPEISDILPKGRRSGQSHVIACGLTAEAGMAVIVNVEAPSRPAIRSISPSSGW